MQRYSNLDAPSKTFQFLQRSGLITPDGRPIPRSDRSADSIRPPEPFKLDQRLKPAVVTEIVKRYESGEPSTSLAVTFSLSKNSVIKIIRDANILIRRQSLTVEQASEAEQLYIGGQSLAKIGLHFGVDHGTVWRALKKRGVSMRDTHGRPT